MCESHAYLLNGPVEEKIMEDVTDLTFEGDKIVLTNLLGDVQRLNARLKEIAFLDHKIVLETRSD